MDTKAEISTVSQFDAVKWVVVVALIAAGVVGNNYYADESLLYRVLALLVLGALAAVVAFQTSRGLAFWGLIKESRIEIRKVVWPNRQETTQTTLIVVGVVLLTALLLWGLDSLIGWLVSLIIG